MPAPRRGARRVRLVLPALLAMSGPPVLAGPAAAEVKEHEVRRLLMLKSECQVSGVEAGRAEDADRFTATCTNLSHYPDGVEVHCPDGGDDRDCRILTPARVFPHLRALGR